MSPFSLLFFFSDALGEREKAAVSSTGFLLENGFFLNNATIEHLAPVYQLVRDHLTMACDECFDKAFNMDERLECDKHCDIGGPLTFNQLAAVYEDVRARLVGECYDYFAGSPLSPLLYYKQFLALGIDAGGSGERAEWNLPMRLWLSQLSLAVKKNIAEFLARELFTADNKFFRANEQSCLVSANYCSRTYGRRLVVEDYDYYADGLKARILELELDLEQRECEVDVLSRLLNDCKNRLSNTNLDISDDI